jgi:hypothetical protein
VQCAKRDAGLKSEPALSVFAWSDAEWRSLRAARQPMKLEEQSLGGICGVEGAINPVAENITIAHYI